MNDLFEINNFVAVRDKCIECLNAKRMSGIIGYPGAGKTIALKHFADNNEGVYYLRVRKSMRTMDFYAGLLEAIGQQVTVKGQSVHYLMNKISYNLNLDDTNKLIIIDEAGKFKPGQLEYIHELRDLTEQTTGILLAGPEYFHDHLIGWEKDNITGIPELTRRIHSFIWLARPTKIEVSMICKNYDIVDKEKVAQIFKNGQNFAKIMNLIEAEIE